jgi:hypothetical protein
MFKHPDNHAGVVKHTNQNILFKPGMFNATSRTRKPLERFQRFFDRIIWPASVGRMPASVHSSAMVDDSDSHSSLQIAKGSGSVKADQWRTQSTVLFIALFDAWQINGKIPDMDAPRHAPDSKPGKDAERVENLVRARLREDLHARTEKPTAEQLHKVNTTRSGRNYLQHYRAILELSVALRVLASRELSPNDVRRGCDAMARAFQIWARMAIHMTPYFHLVMHFPDIFLAMGPAYGWWTFPYERNNGFLGRFNHNGHAGGELEATMMRGWWKSMFVYELVCLSLFISGHVTLLTHRLLLRLRILSGCLIETTKTRGHLSSSRAASRVKRAIEEVLCRRTLLK